MISMDEAVTVARQHFIQLFGDSVGNPLPEEAEISDDNQFWYVTLSYKNEKETLSQSLPGHGCIRFSRSTPRTARSCP